MSCSDFFIFVFMFMLNCVYTENNFSFLYNYESKVSSINVTYEKIVKDKGIADIPGSRF